LAKQGQAAASKPLLDMMKAVLGYTLLPRLLRAGLIGGVALAFAASFGPRAVAADDDEPFEETLIKGLLGGLGLNKDQGSIDYRERSPLVVPPSRDLPPPQSASAALAPDWPKDTESKKNKRIRDKRGSAGFDEDARPLLPSQLEAGRRRNSPRDVGGGDDNGRRLTPDELGYKGGLFGALFGGKDKDESTVFPGEPPRANLTDPPKGYLTPSPTYPYGLTERKEAPKPYNLENRGTD
jgi:hypothetical protein